MGENQSSEVGAKPVGSEEALKLCTRLDADMAALRVAYEHYFLGLERKPPRLLHDALKTKIANLKGAPFINGATARFRIESLNNKFLAYERMWARTLNEIENGTYRRDLYKARLKSRRREGAPKSNAAQEESPPPALAPAKTAAAPPPRPVETAGGAILGDAKVKAIYDAYVAAKQECNEDISRISLAGLAQSLRKQVPELLKQHQAKSVEFKVAIKDGKAVLKAFPK